MSLSSLSLTFNNVVRSHVIDIGLLDDDFSEGIEEFAVVLQQSGRVLAKTTIRLFEDECMYLLYVRTCRLWMPDHMNGSFTIWGEVSTK